MRLQLPFELFQNVILHISDPRDLCAVSLSCHSLRVIGQSILFRNPAPSSIDDHSKFMDSIMASPERLALLVREYSQRLPIYSLYPWIPGAGEISKSLHQLLRKTQSSLPLMLNLKALDYRCSNRGQPTVFILRNCWDFQLEILQWDARAHDEELYRCFIPTQPELRHISITGPGKGAVDELAPIPLACPKLESLCGRERDIHLLLPGKAITHLMWRASQDDRLMDPWTFSDRAIANLAPELNCVQYFVDFFSIHRRGVILRHMPNLTHMEIFESYHTELGTLVVALRFLRILVISKIRPPSIWPPLDFGTDSLLNVEMAFKNCSSLSCVYIEDLDASRQDSSVIYKRYQRQNYEEWDNEHSMRFDRVDEGEAHVWWVPHWSR